MDDKALVSAIVEEIGPEGVKRYKTGPGFYVDHETWGCPFNPLEEWEHTFLVIEAMRKTGFFFRFLMTTEAVVVTFGDTRRLTREADDVSQVKRLILEAALAARRGE